MWALSALEFHDLPVRECHILPVGGAIDVRVVPVLPIGRVSVSTTHARFWTLKAMMEHSMIISISICVYVRVFC